MRSFIKGLFVTLAFFSIQKTFSQQIIKPSAFKRDFLKSINSVRQKGCNCGTTYMPPVPAMIWNDQLEIAAIRHAEDMYDKNYFSHTSKNGRTVEDRILAAGYTYKGYRSFAIGENIAQGQMSIAEVMEGWIKSEGHCRNLMNPQYREVGVAMYNDYWVQDFGGRESFTEEQQKLIKSGKIKVIESQ
ncbi:MAG: CAP domain-containing protein [Mucilaginibacter sp.]